MGAEARGGKGGALLRGWYWQARGSFLPAALAQTNSSPAGPAVKSPGPPWALFAQASAALYSYLTAAHSGISCSISLGLPPKATCPKLSRAEAGYLLHTSLLLL